MRPQVPVRPSPRTTTPGPLGLPGPLRCPGPLLEQMPPPGLKGRDLTSFYRNLVKTAECHHFSCIRPAIVPISKTGFKVSSWNSEISNIRSLLSQGINGPYLTGNEGLWSKRRSVARCARVRSAVRTPDLRLRLDLPGVLGGADLGAVLAVFSTAWFLDVLQEIMTETRSGT